MARGNFSENKVYGVKVGRRDPSFSALGGEDPINALIGESRLRIPKQIGPKGGEYDFLRQFSTSQRKRLAGAMLTSTQGGVPVDVLHREMSGKIPALARMNADEFGAWYFREALRGLDLRKELRASGGIKGLRRRKEREEARALQDRVEARVESLLSGNDEDLFGRLVTDDPLTFDDGETVLSDKYRKAIQLNDDIARGTADASAIFGESLERGTNTIGIGNTFRVSGSSGVSLAHKYDSSLTVGKPAMIVDIDETLFTGTKKAGRIESKIMDLKAKGSVPSSTWAPWNEATKQGKPIREMIDFVKNLQESGIQPVFMTARDEALRDFTTNVLNKHGLDTRFLMMRGLEQSQQDLSPSKLKAQMIDDMKGKFNFVAFLDDSASNVAMGYEKGIPLGIIPPKGGFDSLEASIVRGVEAAGKMGDEFADKALETLDPILRAGKEGKMTKNTFQMIMENAKTAARMAVQRRV